MSFKWVALPAITVGLVASFSTTASAAIITRTYGQDLDNGNFTAYAPKTSLFDFNLDGVNDFSFTHATSKPGNTPSNIADFNGKLTLDSASQSQFLAVVKDFDTIDARGQTSPIGNYVETLAGGFVVGGNQLSGFIQISPPGATAYDDRLLDSTGTGNSGAFSVATGERDPLDGDIPVYVGFAFGSITNPNYGYLVFDHIGNDDSYTQGDRNAATLERIVYESTPGKPITIPTSSVPEPTSLAAIGLASLMLVRRRRA